jgi:hypothetical protein
MSLELATLVNTFLKCIPNGRQPGHSFALTARVLPCTESLSFSSRTCSELETARTGLIAAWPQAHFNSLALIRGKGYFVVKSSHVVYLTYIDGISPVESPQFLGQAPPVNKRPFSLGNGYGNGNHRVGLKEKAFLL